MSPPETAQQVYDRLWADACDWFAAGRVRTDPYLQNRADDDRRGLSLITRPDAATCTRIEALIDELREIAPGQHFYRFDELHITVLSLINVGAGVALAAGPVEAYRALFADLFPRVRPFEVHYRGVTASRDCVLLRGDPAGDALNALRDRLRQELPRAGLSGTLDQRYRIVTAHSTIMRFRSQPDDLPRLVQFLESGHESDLGGFTVEQIEFVENDWFMSHDKVKLLARYALAGDS